MLLIFVMVSRGHWVKSISQALKAHERPALQTRPGENHDYVHLDWPQAADILALGGDAEILN